MAIVDKDMKEDSMHSVLTSLSSNQDVETLSPEDVAWADSCLNKDVDAPDADWTSIKDALLEILSSQEESPANFSVGQSNMPLSVDRSFNPGENLTSVESGSGSARSEDPFDGDFGEAESIDISDDDDEDDLILRNKRGRARGKILVNNVLRPNYSEDVKLENLDIDLSSSLTINDVGPPLEDIFKVWDLGISDVDEQDELTKQLNKALADVPSQIQSNTDDSVILKDLMHVSIDDLISGIGDLSL